MEIFSSQFLAVTLSALDNITANGKSITREKFCVAIGLDDSFMPVISYMLGMAEFQAFEVVRKAGIRRKVPKVMPGECAGLEPDQLTACVTAPASPVVSVSEPVTTPDPEPVTEAIGEPTSTVPINASFGQPGLITEPVFNGPVIAVSSKPILKLLGTEGDSIALMAKASKCAARNGINWDDILSTLENTDYDYIAAKLENHFDVRSA